MINKPNKRRMICAICKGSDVVVDAWAEWDIPAQEWTLRSTFDEAYCIDCEQSCDLEEPELTDEEQADYDKPTGVLVPCCSECDDACSDCANPNYEEEPLDAKQIGQLVAEALPTLKWTLLESNVVVIGADIGVKK
jgi:hypothetical protein